MEILVLILFFVYAGIGSLIGGSVCVAIEVGASPEGTLQEIRVGVGAVLLGMLAGIIWPATLLFWYFYKETS